MIRDFDYKHKGLCNDCNKSKTLDSMIGSLGVYHCIDCETEKYAPDNFQIELNNHPLKNSVVKKLIAWCFG